MPWLPGPNPFPGHLGQATFSEIEWEVLERTLRCSEQAVVLSVPRVSCHSCHPSWEMLYRCGEGVNTKYLPSVPSAVLTGTSLWCLLSTSCFPQASSGGARLVKCYLKVPAGRS